MVTLPQQSIRNVVDVQYSSKQASQQFRLQYVESLLSLTPSPPQKNINRLLQLTVKNTLRFLLDSHNMFSTTFSLKKPAV